MLSAKKENLITAVKSAGISPVTRTSPNIVGSIQGLQQRLGDFSLAEVAAAESKTKTLILRLLELQSQLTLLAEIKRSITSMGDTIEQTNIGRETMIGSFASLHPQEANQATNLIMFPLGVRLAEHNTRQGLPDAIGIRPAVSEPGSALTRESVRADVNEQTTSFILVDSLELSDSSPRHRTIASSSMADESQRVGFESVAQLQPASVAQPDSLTHEDPIDSGELDQSASATAAGAKQSDPVSHTNLLAAKLEFDQQLLDDLIKNYGEFVTSAEAQGTAKPQGSMASAPMMTAKIILEPPTTASVANPGQRPLSTPKRDGEIDRELKKLVKDYGEYDIYSRQNPTRFKLGVIGALILLAAFLSGFYFFSSTTSSAPATVAQPASITPSAEKVSQKQDNSSSLEIGTTHMSPVTKK